MAEVEWYVEAEVVVAVCVGDDLRAGELLRQFTKAELNDFLKIITRVREMTIDEIAVSAAERLRT